MISTSMMSSMPNTALFGSAGGVIATDEAVVVVVGNDDDDGDNEEDIVSVRQQQEEATRLAAVAVEEQERTRVEAEAAQLATPQQQLAQDNEQTETARLSVVVVESELAARQLLVEEHEHEQERTRQQEEALPSASSPVTSISASPSPSTSPSKPTSTSTSTTSFAKQMKHMFDSTSSYGPSRAFSSNGSSSACRNSGTSTSFNKKSTQKKAVMVAVKKAVAVSPIKGTEKEKEIVTTSAGAGAGAGADTPATNNNSTIGSATLVVPRCDSGGEDDTDHTDWGDRLSTNNNKLGTTTTEAKARNKDVLEDGNDDDDERMELVSSSQLPTTTQTPSSTPPPSTTSSLSVAARMKQMFDSTSSDEPSRAFGSNSNNHKYKMSRISHHHRHHHHREPKKEEKAATEHQWEEGFAEETDRTGSRESVLVKDDSEEMLIEEVNALISTVMEGIVATTAEIGGVDGNGDQGDGDTESIIEEIIIDDDDYEDRDDNDDNHHNIDGMSVTTDGEFFETTARVEVSPEFVTTQNATGNDHNGDADQDGRSYDEFTVERSDWECDESTMDDDDDEFGDDDTNDIVVTVNAVENSAHKDVGDKRASVLFYPSSKVGTVEHTQRDNRIDEDDGKNGTAVAFVVATTSISTTPPSQKDATTASWCVAVGSTINSPTVADFSRQDRRPSTTGKLGERLKMFDSPTHSKSLNSCRTIPGAVTKQPSSWRQEKSLLALSKKDTTTTTTTTDTQSTQVKHIVNKQPGDLLVEQIVVLLNEPECMKNKNALAQRIISLITSRSNDDNEGSNNDIEIKMVIPAATMTPIDLSHSNLLDTTTYSSRSRSHRSHRRETHSDSLDTTTTHSSRSNRRGVLGSPKTTTTTKKSLTMREEEATTYMCRKNDYFQDSGLKKMQNDDALVQKEKLRRCYDPDSISARKMKRVSIKDLKKKKEEQQQQQKSSSSFIQDIKIDSELRSNEEKPPLIANSLSSLVAAVDSESIMARIKPTDKVRTKSKHHHARTTTTTIEKNPSTKKLGEQLKMFQSPPPGPSSSPTSSTPRWSSPSLSSPRQTSSRTTSFNGSPISKLVSKEFFVSMTSTLTTTMEKDDAISSFTEDISILTDNKTKAVRVNTSKKLSHIQRLWQKMNKSKKKDTKKNKNKNKSSPSPQPAVIVVPLSKSMTVDKNSSASSVPTTTESKKKKSVISSLFGVGGGNNSKDGFTLDDFEQKRIDWNEIDIAKWEYYLNDDEFMKQFGGVTKDEFYQLPKWKRDKQKRQVRVAF